MSAWPLPKTCFQFLKRLDLFPSLFGMSLKPCFSLKRKKREREKTRLPLSDAFAHQPGGVRLAFLSVLVILEMIRDCKLRDAALRGEVPIPPWKIQFLIILRILICQGASKCLESTNAC